MAELSREGLVLIAAEALDDYTCVHDNAELAYLGCPECAPRAAVDALLAAIADDAEARGCWSNYGSEHYADRLRALLPEER